MKTIILCILLSHCIACNFSPPTNVHHQEEIKKDSLPTKINFDTILKKQLLSYKLYLDYESDNQWKSPNKHYEILYKFVDKFENDSIINQLSRKEIDNSFIIHIEAGMTKDISPKIARKRMEDIKNIISTMLGKNIDYDMEIIKILRNLKYKEEHDIEIKINRLKY